MQSGKPQCKRLHNCAEKDSSPTPTTQSLARISLAKPTAVAFRTSKVMT